MDITAHGGALGTGRNSQRFFDKIKDYPVDIIEVDIYQWRGHLYISHLPKLFPQKRAITLRYVFEFIKEHSFRINCDIKQKGLVKPVLALAKDVGVTENIIFTGSVSLKDICNLTEGCAYLNTVIYRPLKPVKENLHKIKAFIDNLNCAQIKGINLSYKYCTDEMLEKAHELGIRLSVFTVDDPKVLERLVKSPAIDNLTTNIPDAALKLLGRL